MPSDFEKVTPCGNVCAWCLYFKWGRCGGCRQGYCGGRKTECPIRGCASRRGMQHCSDCKDFPCMLTYAYYAHMTKWLDTLKEEKKKVLGAR
ncbi:MAG: DUF3795 domain-containing protein [Thermoplasmata archaeon]